MEITSSNQVLVDMELDGDDMVLMSKGKISIKKTIINIPIEYRGDSVEFLFVISLKDAE